MKMKNEKVVNQIKNMDEKKPIFEIKELPKPVAQMDRQGCIR
jgi:hypothetical protein